MVQNLAWKDSNWKLITFEKGIQKLAGLEPENMAKYGPSSGYLFSCGAGENEGLSPICS